MDKQIAVVILNWNGKTLLEQFLPSVLAYSKQATVYVADNASNDNSIAFIQSKYPEVKLIKNTINLGYAGGYNTTLKEVKEPIYCLLNNDVEVTKDWLKPILEVFLENKDIAIAQPKILDFKAKSNFEYAGAAGGYIDMLGYPYCRGRIFNTLEKDTHQYQNKEIIFWASGACLFIRRSVFHELNGFDPHFFAHMEEIDLCWRAFNKNYKTVYLPQSEVYHLGGASLDSQNPKKTFLNFRNSLFCLIKNAGSSVFLLVFIRLLLDALAGVYFLFQFKIHHFLAIIKAHFSFYYYLPKMLRKRKKLKQKQGYYQYKSIVWLYFLKQKRFFTDLVKN